MTSALPLADRIFTCLKEEIITCQRQPGELLNELELARRFETSRTPVREALNRLSQAGLVTILRNRGTSVSPITIKDILNILQLRSLIEPACARYAASKLTDEQLDALEHLPEIERRDAKKVGIGKLLQMNRQFHVAIARCTGNDLIAELVDSLLESSTRHDYFLMESFSGNWVGHSDICRALKHRSPEQARQAMARHIERSRKRMSEIFSGALLAT